MKKIATISIISALALGLAACNSPGDRAVGGALIGGASGAAIGGLATGRGSGALVGGLIGAGAGAVIGASTASEPGLSCYRDRFGRRICEEVY